MNKSTLHLVSLIALVSSGIGSSFGLGASETVSSSGSFAVPVSESPSAAAYRGLIYGRVTTTDGTTHEGRLRWGGNEEALWSNYFNGVKDRNPWARHVPEEQLMADRPIEIFGITFGSRRAQIDLERPLMVRFGDIARIDADGRDLTATLKSGRVIELDRFEADDFADGLSLWEDERGPVELGEWPLRSVEFLPTPSLGNVPAPLYGTVHTALGAFTGLIQWDREACLASDELVGHGADGEKRVSFDTIRTIARISHDSSRLVLRDGRELVLGGTRAVGEGNRGVYVDDSRYGRVLVSWTAFDRIEFDHDRPARAPAYGDFPPGEPLRGSVRREDGRALAGRIVFDLDESETTQTLDAPVRGIHYTIPFGLVASIGPAGDDHPDARQAKVTLHSGEHLYLERKDDLGEKNAGLLVFPDGREDPDYVPWSEVDRLELYRPSAAYPPLSAMGR